MKKIALVILAALLAGIVISHAQTPAEISQQSDTITIPFAEYKELMLLKKSVATRAVESPKLLQLENAVKILNDRLATGTNSPEEALKQTVIAVTPSEYKYLVDAVMVLFASFCAKIIHALIAKYGASTGGVPGLFVRLVSLAAVRPVPKVIPENPRPNPLPDPQPTVLKP